jgi:hypothetical protein
MSHIRDMQLPRQSVLFVLSSRHGTVWNLRQLPAFGTTCCLVLPDRSAKETTCSFKPFISYYLVSDCPLNFQQENLTFPNDFPHTQPSHCSSLLHYSPERMPGSLIKFVHPENRDPQINWCYYVGYNLNGKIK